MMYRMLLALPAAALASTAATGRIWKPELRQPIPAARDDLASQTTLTMDNAGAPNFVNTPVVDSHLPQVQPQQRPHRMPSRFTLEDDEALQEALRYRPPPVGEAALNSGLSVEVSAW